jgi:uncharacterized damage-inducible protein DinB
MRDMAPLPGYHPEIGLLLALLQDGTKEWLNEMGAWMGTEGDPSMETITWQPYPGSYSIGGIVLHIAAVERIWFEQAALNSPLSDADRKLYLTAETDVDAGKWPSPPRENWAWYVNLLGQARQKSIETLKEFTDPDRVVDDVSLRWIVGHVAQHESYHGGQAVLLNELFKLKSAQDL